MYKIKERNSKAIGFKLNGRKPQPEPSLGWVNSKPLKLQQQLQFTEEVVTG